MRTLTNAILILSVGLLGGCSSDKKTTAPLPAGDATYKVTFASTWSATTHPMNFPGNPHFSGLIGGTHNSTVSFWTLGGLATEGIEIMAETGATGSLAGEVEDAITAGTANQVLLGGGIAVSPGSVEMTFNITEEFPLVTLVSMVAPSPDWFVGVMGLTLLDNGQWVDELTADLHAYDAGTDSGTNYTSANADTDPAEGISELDMEPFLVNGVIPTLGTYTFTRQ